MHKKFELNRTKIKGGCQSYTKAAPKESWNDLTLVRSSSTYAAQVPKLRSSATKTHTRTYTSTVGKNPTFRPGIAFARTFQGPYAPRVQLQLKSLNQDGQCKKFIM